jgi:hypothetical protein
MGFSQGHTIKLKKSSCVGLRHKMSIVYDYSWLLPSTSKVSESNWWAVLPPDQQSSCCGRPRQTHIMVLHCLLTHPHLRSLATSHPAGALTASAQAGISMPLPGLVLLGSFQTLPVLYG